MSAWTAYWIAAAAVTAGLFIRVVLTMAQEDMEDANAKEFIDDSESDPAQSTSKPRPKSSE